VDKERGAGRGREMETAREEGEKREKDKGNLLRSVVSIYNFYKFLLFLEVLFFGRSLLPPHRR